MARAARQPRSRAVGHTLSSPTKQPEPLPSYNPYSQSPSPSPYATRPIPIQHTDDGYHTPNLDISTFDFSTSPYPQPASSPFDYSSTSITPESFSSSFQPYPQPPPSDTDDMDAVDPTPKSNKGKSKATDPAYIPRPRNAFMLYRSNLVGLVKDGKIPEAFVQATNDYQRSEKKRLDAESATKVASGSSPSDDSDKKPKKPSKPKPNAQPLAPETEEVLGKGRTGGNVPQSTQSKILSIMWRDHVSASEKKVWYAKALKEKEDHAAKYPGYKFQPKSKATKEKESEERRRLKEEAKLLKGKKNGKRVARQASPLVTSTALASTIHSPPPMDHRSYPFPMPALSLPSLNSEAPYPYPPPDLIPMPVHYEPMPPDPRYLGGFPMEHSQSSDSFSSYSNSYSNTSEDSSFQFLWENQQFAGMPVTMSPHPSSRGNSVDEPFGALDNMQDLSWMENLGLDEPFHPEGLVPMPVQFELFEETTENLASLFSEDTDMATARPNMPHGYPESHPLQSQQASPARYQPIPYESPSRPHPLGSQSDYHLSTPTRQPDYPLYDPDAQLLAMGVDSYPSLDHQPFPVSIEPIHPMNMTEHLNQQLGPTLTSAQILSPLDSAFTISSPPTARYVSNSEFPDATRDKERDRGWLARSPSVNAGFPSIMESSGFGELGDGSGGDIFDWDEDGRGMENRQDGETRVSPGKEDLGKAVPGLARSRAVGKRFMGANIEVGKPVA